MADLKAMRRRFEADISKLLARIEAIDLLESAAKEAQPEPIQPKAKAKTKAKAATKSRTPAAASHPTNDSSPSMSQYCKDLLDGDENEWMTMNELVAAVQAKYPGTSRAAVVTAYRRWEQRGEAELKGSRETGFRARLKTRGENGGAATTAT